MGDYHLGIANFLIEVTSIREDDVTMALCIEGAISDTVIDISGAALMQGL